MKLFRTYLLALSFLILPPFSSPVFGEGDCSIAQEAIKRASVIRGLKVKKNVPCYVRNKEAVKNFILDTVKTKIPPRKLEMEEVTFKALGFLPDSFAYEKGIVELYLSQLGGYYDPEKQHFVMAGWLPAMMQPTIAAHELTHALQDQYYNLSKFIDPKSENSDEQLARSALVEGDATAVMMDYMRELAGQGPLEGEADVNSFMLQNVVGMSLTAGLKDVPQSLQLLLVFPYTSGLRFAHTLLRDGGYSAIDKAFLKPPRSTEEILHPEIYKNGGQDFITFDDKELASKYLDEGAVVAYHDTFGEFAISALLGNFIVDKLKVAQAAAGWGGDRAIVADNKGARNIVWKTHWDTLRDADEFFSLYSEAVRNRFSLKGGDLGSWTAIPEKRMLKIEREGSDVIISVKK